MRLITQQRGDFDFVVKNKEFNAPLKSFIKQLKIQSLRDQERNQQKVAREQLIAEAEAAAEQERLEEEEMRREEEEQSREPEETVQNIISSGQSTKSNDNPLEMIKQLKELLDAGILSQEEFDEKKAELLKRI